jgi:hypothetical protein
MGDEEVEVLQEDITLVCPLAKKRILEPVKGPQCPHVQPFDRKSFVDFAAISTTPGIAACPVCDTPVKASELVADKVFAQALASAPAGCVKFARKQGRLFPVQEASLPNGAVCTDLSDISTGDTPSKPVQPAAQRPSPQQKAEKGPDTVDLSLDDSPSDSDADTVDMPNDDNTAADRTYENLRAVKAEVDKAVEGRGAETHQAATKSNWREDFMMTQSRTKEEAKRVAKERRETQQTHQMDNGRGRNSGGYGDGYGGGRGGGHGDEGTAIEQFTRNLKLLAIEDAQKRWKISESGSARPEGGRAGAGGGSARGSASATAFRDEEDAMLWDGDGYDELAAQQAVNTITAPCNLLMGKAKWTGKIAGVKVLFPFVKPLAPQLQLMSKAIAAYKSRAHALLESPTGTGKSAALLCSALAWQRQNEMDTGRTVKILYGCRTHSQIKQVVKELKRTPYRPTMAVLGSRRQYCSNERVVDGKEEAFKNMALNQRCQKAVKGFNEKKDTAGAGADDGGRKYSCECYKGIKELGFAHATHEVLQPPVPVVENPRGGPRGGGSGSGCSSGGGDGLETASEQGVWDIEDLVSFCKEPATEQQRRHEQMTPAERQALRTGAAGEGSVAVSTWEVGCAYYASKALASQAQIVFCPYQYLLDPLIVKQMGIETDGAVVLLDEAHNIGSVCRDSGSTDTTIFELMRGVEWLCYLSSLHHEVKNVTLPHDVGRSEEREWREGGGINGHINGVLRLRDVAPLIIDFVHAVVTLLQTTAQRWERSSKPAAHLQKNRKFRIPIDSAVEVEDLGWGPHVPPLQTPSKGKGGTSLEGTLGVARFIEQLHASFDKPRFGHPVYCPPKLGTAYFSFLSSLLAGVTKCLQDNSMPINELDSVEALIATLTLATDVQTMRPQASAQAATKADGGGSGRGTNMEHYVVSLQAYANDAEDEDVHTDDDWPQHKQPKHRSFQDGSRW